MIDAEVLEGQQRLEADRALITLCCKHSGHVRASQAVPPEAPTGLASCSEPVGCTACLKAELGLIEPLPAGVALLLSMLIPRQNFKLPAL